MADTLRMVCVLAGDIKREPAAQIKFGVFLEVVSRHFNLLDIRDVSLRGLSKVVNALQVFHPKLREWRKRYWKNIPAYYARSRQASRYIAAQSATVDLCLQLGVLFDAKAVASASSMPSVIYTDYTASLSALRPEAGRSPFTPAQLQEWMDLEKLAYERAAHIFTRAKFVRENIISEYGIPAERVTAIGGGINFRELPIVEPQAQYEAPVVLFIGRDFYRKGGDLLLSAFAEAHREFPAARLLFLTRDPIPEGFSLAGVELVSSDWDRDKIDACFRLANIFVLPSRLETWGDVLLEAMSYGLASVTSDDLPMQEILEDGRTGLIVPSDNAEALRDGLLKLFKDGALRYRLGCAAQAQARQFYTWDHIVSQMLSVVGSLEVLSKE